VVGPRHTWYGADLIKFGDKRRTSLLLLLLLLFLFFLSSIWFDDLTVSSIH
jgi:hypothetical protein